MSLPQQVTLRYVTNLLTEGKNDVFEIERVVQHPQVIEGDAAGFYYEATVVTTNDFGSKKAYGVTPRQAVMRALEKHGVKFI